MVTALVRQTILEVDGNSGTTDPGSAFGGWQPEPGYFLQSDDSRHTLHVQALVQFRYVLNLQSDSPGPLIGSLRDDHRNHPATAGRTIGADGDDVRSGFGTARTRLRLHGNIRDSQWLYMLEGDFSRGHGSLAIGDAWIAHAFNDPNGTVIVGRFKAPMLREELLDSALQQAVERSLVNEEFSAGRTQGVLLDYRTDRLHGSVAASNGLAEQCGETARALAYDSEFALTGRGEILLGGRWDQFADMPSSPGASRGVMLGAALHYERGEFGTAAGELDLFQWTVDASIELGGANVFAYVANRQLDGTVEADQFGTVVQAGIFLCEEWELFGRYEWGELDFGGDDLSILTAGATRYFANHRLKWTMDIGFGLNEVPVQWIGGGFRGRFTPGMTGWRIDDRGHDGQVVVRTQLQLSF